MSDQASRSSVEISMYFGIVTCSTFYLKEALYPQRGTLHIINLLSEGQAKARDK